MLNRLRSLFAGDTAADDALVSFANGLPQVLEVAGCQLDLSDCWQVVDGLPVPDWQRVGAQLDGYGADVHGRLWGEAEVAWLAHLAAAFGPAYAVHRRDDILVLSNYSARQAHISLDFIAKTRNRICGILQELAQISLWGHEILIVVADSEQYYRYVGRYYPEQGEFSLSSGMYINHGCGHFITSSVDGDLSGVEPVIAHEMTHALLDHLPIPAWLNEGLAVNCEERLSRPCAELYTVAEMRAKHYAFWNESTIQEFWSGASFLRTDDGNMLSYDLAKILVSQFGHDWAAFKRFVLAADLGDAANAAALGHLDIDLGVAASALSGHEFSERWTPQPSTWQREPERGAFSD